MEFATVDEFIKQMKKIYSEPKSKDRYQLIIATGNLRAVVQPKVTTQRLNALLVENINSEIIEKIEKAAKEHNIEPLKCLKFFFDDQKAR